MFKKIKDFISTRARNAEHLDRIEELEDSLYAAERQIGFLQLAMDASRKDQDHTRILKETNESLMVENDLLRNQVDMLSKKISMLETLSVRFFYSRMDPTGNPLWDEFRLLLDVVHGRTSAEVRGRFLNQIGEPAYKWIDDRLMEGGQG